MKAPALVLLGLPLVLACGPEPAPQFETVNLALSTGNGVSLNGTTFGDVSLQGADPSLSNDFGEPIGSFPIWQPPPIWNPFDPVSGVGPNGPEFDGAQLADLQGVQVDTGLELTEIMGAQLEGRLANGEAALLTIAGVAMGGGSNDDLLYYLVYAADGMGWSPLCGYASSGEPIPALAVPGQWDQRAGVAGGGSWAYADGAMTFACRGSSIAKCMEFGYKPWIDPGSEEGDIEERSKSRINQANHLQACVRMLRADYCGDGQSWTVDGRVIEFWDSMEMHSESQDWTFEAAWTPDGAACVSKTRVNKPSDLPSGCATLLSESSCLEEEIDDMYEDEGKYINSAYETNLEL